MSSEWTMIRNQNEESRDSIWLGWKAASWTATIHCAHAQFIHSRLANVGGYTFGLTVAYGENTAVKRRLL